MLTIREGDLSDTATQQLVFLHLAGMHACSPPENVHALGATGLRAPDVTVWTAWEDDRIAGIVALRRLEADRGELKSMRTHPDFLRRGVAWALLGHVIEQACSLGLTRLSLETGAGPAFEPALALYRKRGFVDGDTFSGYERTDFNQFVHLDLRGETRASGVVA